MIVEYKHQQLDHKVPLTDASGKPLGWDQIKKLIKDDERERASKEEGYDERFFRSLSGALFVEKSRGRVTETEASNAD